ncbi:THAP domain-containing protein 1 [Halyomorpha halys]|uniref:THAP domain-containing protein 1 n=1 Tax=Halyomorpha halys TaxID=286706 RepID=UPI0006D4D9F3|nr:uncharacterized protein LOC106688135 [Halyomorpha halys]
MPGPKCNVHLCSNHHGLLNDQNEKITLHRFPKKPELRNIWLEKCQKKGNWNVDYGYICSEHFLKDDFKRDLQAELLGYKGRRKLKPFAVPSLNLPGGNTIINKIPSEIEVLCEKEYDKRLELFEECFSTRKAEIPLSYKMFRKWYKDIKKAESNNFETGLKTLDENYSKLPSHSKKVRRQIEEQNNVRAQSKRNLVMQKKMMEKLFLATYFEAPFSGKNINKLDKYYADKAKDILLKSWALAPDSYNRLAKKLNLPNKDVLFAWNNENNCNN